MADYHSSQPNQYHDDSPSPREIGREERTWAMLCHLSAFAGYIIPVLGNIIGPLVMWLLKREEYPLVDDQGKESLNFQITITIAFFLAGVLCLVIIGFFLLPLIMLFDIVMIIVATIKANEGQYFRYPLCMRFIK